MTKAEILELIRKQKDDAQRQHDYELISDDALHVSLSALRLAEEYVTQIKSIK
jgi:hypothetical protein